MAPQVYWKGYPKLSFFIGAVTMTPTTTDSEKLKFNDLNR
jgi:non-homologous end joining protein Ku